MVEDAGSKTWVTFRKKGNSMLWKVLQIQCGLTLSERERERRRERKREASYKARKPHCIRKDCFFFANNLWSEHGPGYYWWEQVIVINLQLSLPKAQEKFPPSATKLTIFFLPRFSKFVFRRPFASIWSRHTILSPVSSYVEVTMASSSAKCQGDTVTTSNFGYVKKSP
jgi:hypothetical protein